MLILYLYTKIQIFAPSAIKGFKNLATNYMKKVWHFSAASDPIGR